MIIIHRYVTFFVLLLLATGCNLREELIFNLEINILHDSVEDREYILEIVHLDEPRYMDRHPVAYSYDLFEKDINLYLTENRAVNVPVEMDMRYSITVFETTLREEGENINIHKRIGNQLWVEEVSIYEDTEVVIDIN